MCITGLQRSYVEFPLNVRAALRGLYAPTPLESVALFGVRPEKDAWASVRVHLPPLANETLQRPCGYHPPAWFSAYARTNAGRVQFAFNFVQSMCDMDACMHLIENHEQTVRGGELFSTIARLRLDLAWEAVLRMPRGGLQPATVHLPRMNAKAGVNDKWALGTRDAMKVYLTRLHAISAANVLHGGKTGKNATSLFYMHSNQSVGAATTDIVCDPHGSLEAFACRPRFDRHTAWQGTLPVAPTVAHTRNATHTAAHTDRFVSGLVEPHRFVLTSEAFLLWALWRRNIAVQCSVTGDRTRYLNMWPLRC